MKSANPRQEPKKGLSIVICCHNSARRLPKTLLHLMSQKVPAELAWEIIVVDNASTDDTAEIVRAAWPEHSGAPLRIVHEPQLGLSHARSKGIQFANYELVSFVDDDNWLAPDWVSKVSQIMSNHPEVGACGGRTEAVHEAEPPDWFDQYAQCYAVGRQAEFEGDVTWRLGHLWGAGLTLRKSAWEQLVRQGFTPLLTDRAGDALSSGGDYELCYALRLARWRIWYSEELVLQHYIPANRLTWEYLCRLWRGFGAQTVGHDPYRMYLEYEAGEIRGIFSRIWLRQLLREMYNAAVRNGLVRLRGRWQGSAFQARLNWKFSLGRIKALCSARSKYDRNIGELPSKDWVQLDRHTAMSQYKHPSVCDQRVVAANQHPLVTALITNYNYGRFLSEAIDSALAQTWTNMEILVVDDGSTDNSREILAQYGDRIRVIHKENGGQASAFNVGIAAVRGEIICFLDSDDSWTKNKVAAIVEKYSQGAWGLVCHDLNLLDGDGAAIGGVSWCDLEAVALAEGDVFESIVNNAYPWVFSPTSGLSLPASLARALLPLPEKEWRICADNLIAYAAISHRPVGVVQGELGRYRLHGQNQFGAVRTDPVRARVVGVVHPASSFLFHKDYLARLGKRLDVSPLDNYQYRRRVVMMVSDRPWTLLPRLWRYNLQSLRGNWRNVRFFAVDTLLAVLIAGRFPINHREMRQRFLEHSEELDSKTRAYLSEWMHDNRA